MSDTMSWNRLLTSERLGGRKSAGALRNEFQRDYDRVVFSSAFRRLHDKTQVFPMPENDHVHSRLTHSLEVSCVGRSLGVIVGEPIVRKYGLAGFASARDFGDIVAAACLAHDIGNPPFGHSGEEAIRAWFCGEERKPHPEMSDAEWEDFRRFDGNAQGIRLLTRLQMAREEGGMRLTYATLGAFSKYPRESIVDCGSGERRSGKKPGFFQSEREIFETTAGKLGLRRLPGKGFWWCRHPLAFLVEAADDICYQILDLEDGFRLGKVGFEETYDLLAAIVRPEHAPHPSDAEKRKAAVGRLRALSIDRLIRETSDLFLENEEAILDGSFDKSLVSSIPSKEKIDAITDIVVERCYKAKEVLETEIAGYEVITTLFNKFIPAAIRPDGADHRKIRTLLPQLFPDEGSDYEKILHITDFISGMTDSFAVSIRRKLSGNS